MAKYDKFTSLKNPERPVQVESAIRDGSGKNIENNYSKQEGYYGGMGVKEADYAKDLISTTGLTVNDDPMSFGMVGGAQKSAVGDGNATLNKLVCVDVVKNQLANTQTVSYSGDNMSVSISNGYVDAQITGSRTGFFVYNTQVGYQIDFIAGNKYLIFLDNLKYLLNNTQFRVIFYKGSTYKDVSANCDFSKPFIVFTPAQSFDSDNFVVAKTYASTTEEENGNYLKYYLRIIDLTQRYGNNDVVNAIIGTGTDAEKVARLLAFDPEILSDTSYNAGTMVPSQSAKLLSVGVNQWNEDWGNYIWNENNNGVRESSASALGCKEHIRVLPNTTYYLFCGTAFTNFYVLLYDTDKNLISYSFGSRNRTFTTPANCEYITFYSYNSYPTTYKNDICINISDPNINGKYYKSKRTPVTLPNYEGHGILKAVTDSQTGITKVVADGTELYPDGNSKKRYVLANMADLSWDGTDGNYRASVSGCAGNGGLNIIGDVRSNIYQAITPQEQYDNTKNGITLGGNGVGSAGQIRIRDTAHNTMESFLAYIANAKVTYPLATEQDVATSIFQSTFPVEQGGTLHFLDEDDNPIAGLQGSGILYAKSTNGAIQGLFNRKDVDWNPENVASITQLESKANKVVEDIEDGEVISRLARDLAPYSDDSGAFQSAPFVSQGTATGNNNPEDYVTTGEYAQLREKQGNTVAVMQLAPAISTVSWAKSEASTELSINSGVASFTVTGQGQNIYFSANRINGHKYLIKADIKTTTATTLVGIGANGAMVSGTNTVASTNWQTVWKLYEPSSTGSFFLGVIDTRASDWDEVQFRNFVFFDVTSWPADVIADLTAHPEHFPWYYNGSLAYNAGSLENSDGVKLVCTKRNLFDGTIYPNSFWNSSGDRQSTPNYDCTGKILVIPNRTIHVISTLGTLYYRIFDKDGNAINTEGSGGYTNPHSGVTIDLPPNAQYIAFNTGFRTHFDSSIHITVSLYYTPEEGGEGYNQHYDYEEPKVYDTGSETLYGVEGSRDSKAPDGTITRRRARHTFTGSETWTNYGSLYSCILTDAIKIPASQDVAAGSILSNSPFFNTVVSYNDLYNNGGTGSYAVSQSGRICISAEDYANISNLTGKTIEYELEIATTEEGTAFPENVDIDDYGMMYWLDENDNLVGIPQGAKFFYPVNYKGFLDDLYSRTDGSANEVVIQSELEVSETARDAVDEQLKAALGGILRQVLAATKSIDFANTDFVDMGDLEWQYSTSDDIFYAYYSNVKTAGKIMSTGYTTVASSTTYANMPNNSVKTSAGEQRINAKNTTYTDATTFKTAMKGQLLAYEKASS